MYTANIYFIETSYGHKVMLTLPDKNYKSKREIGRLENNILHIKRSQSQIFRKNNSILINYHLLKLGEDKFNLITLEYDFDVYWTSRIAWLKYGRFLHFKNNKLEKQLSLELSFFKGTIDEALNEIDELKSEKTSEIKNQNKRIISEVNLAEQFSLFK